MTAQIVPQTQKAPPPTDSQPRHLSDLVVDYLELLGVEYVFGVPGGHIAPLYEALERSQRRGGMRAILSRQESGAASMADGYARETGKLGVCCATTGPGATNLITGIASAYSDRIPILAITGQTLLPKFGAGAFQESSPDWLDTGAMFANCTRYNTVITHPKQLEQKFIAAFKHAFQSPSGPVHLSVPVDVFRAPAPESMSYPHIDRLLQVPAFADLAAIEELSQLLIETQKRDRKVVLLVGEDCTRAGEEIIAFAELMGAAIVTTQGGKSCVNPYHPLYKGVFGFAGHQSARAALTDESVDFILAVGTTLGQWATSTWDKALLNEKLVHVHHDNSFFSRSPMARLHVYGNPKTVFEALLGRQKNVLNGTNGNKSVETLPEVNKREKPPQIEVQKPEDYRSNATPIHPTRLMYEIMQGFPEHTRFLIDTGNCMVWSFHYLFLPQPQYYRSSVELAAMGWAIGGAVGTALGTPDTPVVCLTGDGSFLMNGQEITVAVAEQLPIIFIILNDRSYGMVKQRHRQVVKDGLGFAIPPVDFSLMAQAMGARGYSIHQPEDFQKLDYEEICNHSGPTVLDVHIDPEALSPLGMF
ncbi:MAG: thiamine pyrophosphate-binding protein [Cyanobacteria bacterium SBLK]|nr:thiamine pyrophosphate-binding protein [Cyanobacteria bacterium SBLK]